MNRYKDLKEMKFGRLLVISRAQNCGHNTTWNCICDCGNKTKTTSYNLIKGRARSCGCLALENIKKVNTKHGYRHTRLYNIWCGMKKRCYSTKYEHYDRYGGRGIKVCEEWKNDFVNFKNWALKNGYNDELEIDRVNNNGNYEPNNCKWKSRTMQVRNRSNTIRIEHNGECKTLIEWCKQYEVKYKLAYERYRKKWDFEKISF